MKEITFVMNGVEGVVFGNSNKEAVVNAVPEIAKMYREGKISLTKGVKLAHHTKGVYRPMKLSNNLAGARYWENYMWEVHNL